MSEFFVFGNAVHNAFNTILQKDNGSKQNVFVADVTSDEIWDHYLASYPEGSNPIFRERTEHDCSCCKNFVRNIGDVIYIENGNIISVWDTVIDDEVYNTVSQSMAAFIKSKAIKAPFLVSEPNYGSQKTTSNGETWNHFYASIPKIFMNKHNDSNYIGERKTSMEILKRSILEITDESVEIVSELIAQKSLYRGDEHKGAITLLNTLKKAYNKLKTEREKEIFLWTKSQLNTRIRSTVIGTLLVDISEGVELEKAVGSFEAKVAPANYKRPTALVTQKMIDQAKKKVDELGIEDSLARRYAVREDISVNDVLFVDGSVKTKLIGGAFDSVKPTKKNAASLSTVDEINIKDFLANVVPNANEIEVFVKNEHLSSFVSLVAPVNAQAAPLFKWDNGFSWSYDGEVTDSIRERVKKAGGKVDGDVRVSLSWHNADDLDLSVTNGSQRVWFRERRAFGAQLDIDMNGMDKQDSVAPVENIFWTSRNNIKKGRYSIEVHNYNKRSTSNVGYEVEVEVLGRLYSFVEPKALGDSVRVKIGTIVVDSAGNITVEGLTGGGSSSEKWGIKTEDWTPVDLITRSPNFWNDQKIGNEHVFFMLKGCVNEESTRGFYNEFLRDELIPHRKTFELLASSLKVPYNDNQLSGIGFSSTKRDEILVRVKGSVNRVLNVKF